MRFLRRRAIIAAGVVLVLLLGGGLLVVRSAGSKTQYRTATAVLGTVTQSLQLSGNLEPVAQSNLNFLASGRVASINVAAGQQVAIGQTIATLDATQLQGALTQAQATLDSAQQKYQSDLNGPTAQQTQSAQAAVSTA